MAKSRESVNAPALKMQTGAIGMIDALGFKGIWGTRESPKLKALETLRSVQEAATEAADGWHTVLQKAGPVPSLRSVTGLSVQARTFSDSLVIAASCDDGFEQGITLDGAPLTPERLAERVHAYLLLIVAYSLSHSVLRAALSDPPLIFRGAISVGRFLLEESRLIGPAVDEAAEYGTLPDGAFVWLTPSTRSPLNHNKGLLRAPAWAGQVVRYPVPLRDGRELAAWVVDPLFFCDSPEERALARRKILGSMEPRNVDVALKRQNTLRFLNHVKAERQWRESQTARDEVSKFNEQKSNRIADAAVGQRTPRDKPINRRG